MTEVSGDVSGAAVANGSGRRRQTRAAKEAVGGGDFCKIKNCMKRGFALGKATNAQTSLRWEGRPDIALYNAISKSHRTQ
jgi:hypothetical protein